MSAEITWSGSSRRIYRGEPDTFFGWYRDSDGKAIIVKRLNPAAHPHASLVAEHEAGMLFRANSWGLAAPRLRLFEGTSLHTEFSGHSLEYLASHSIAALTLRETAMLFMHLCRCCAEYAEAGFLHLDVRDANIVVGLEKGHLGGRVCLNEPRLIDVSNALQVGLDLRRPPWISPRMRQIAPEVRALLEADQAGMATMFRKKGVELRSLDQLSAGDFNRVRDAYHAYDSPQDLQLALDGGNLSIDAALQYALGDVLGGCITRSVENSQPSNRALRDQLNDIAARLKQMDPADRYCELSSAADALGAACRGQSNRSSRMLPAVSPELLFRGHGAVSGVAESSMNEVRPEEAYADAEREKSAWRNSSRLLHRRPVWGWSRARVAIASLGAAALSLMLLPLPAMNLNYLMRHDLRERGAIGPFAGFRTAPVALGANRQIATTLVAYSAVGTTDLALKEMGKLRERLVASRLRSSLPARMLAGDSEARNEWTEIRPRLDRLSETGIREAREWLTYCDHIAEAARPRQIQAKAHERLAATGT